MSSVGIRAPDRRGSASAWHDGGAASTTLPSSSALFNFMRALASPESRICAAAAVATNAARGSMGQPVLCCHHASDALTRLRPPSQGSERRPHGPISHVRTSLPVRFCGHDSMAASGR